ncbi:MAG TPA: DUF4398 domain-containing protein [Polyangiaceae bacterium]|nr:DUF4398 domain-containing protein [Polyangiaceae bacterium]
MASRALGRLLFITAILGFSTLTACGGGAIPRDQMTMAQATVKGAEVGGAPQEPKAALHLKLAKEQIAKANSLIAKGDNDEAARVIARAQADADLALALARQANARRETQEAREQIEQIKENIIK